METFFTSDPHFGHHSIIKHCRPEFLRNTVLPEDEEEQNAILRVLALEMDEVLIRNWNTRVKKGDRVWLLGDVAWRADHFLENIRPRLNGTIRLIPGNHDDIVAYARSNAFQQIRYWKTFTEYDVKFQVTHVPLMLEDLRFNAQFNVHGHIHEKPPHTFWHHNICVERTNYAPVHVDELLGDLRKKLEYYNCEGHG
ncbi:phosphohydrolase [Agrobacterium phage Atu_ph04]|uniref:Phosphohydrolase n=1 Tax=Agrobacterium phage Atu_ph04 TaxID=2024263 RepID=A0A223W0F8_9CAUD|nr:phosphoesterase [Agrobacterium phage Atu_ph04]ASV44597.1 phosphohydrolase [Agrobacterium phage Atu_ph04]